MQFICLDFPQCFISCSILSAIFLSVFISFVWNFSYCLRADSNPRGLDPNSLTLGPEPITAVYPLVGKRRIGLPQQTPLHGWPLSAVACCSRIVPVPFVPV